MKIKIHNRKAFDYIVIFLFSIILSFPLFLKDLNIYNGSGFYCIAKGFDFAKNFTSNDGKILTSFLDYFGTGNSILSAPLSTLLLFIVHYFFNSFIISYKIIAYGIMVLSGIFMYKFTKIVSKNDDLSLLASLLYMSTPIHLGQIFVNNSLELGLVFVFIPITFLGLYKMLNTTENSFYITIGVCGLLLSDLKLACLVGIIAFVYLIINYKNWETEHFRKSFFVNLLFIIAITAFFIFPYIEANYYSNYCMSNKTKNEFLESRVSISSLFVTTSSNENILELGPHIIIMLAFSLMAFRKQENEKKKHFIFAFFTMIICIFMSTKLFPWNIFPEWISKIENPYNFLIIASFFETYICATNMSIVLKKFRAKDVLIITLISFMYLIALKGFIPFSNDIEEIDNYDISRIVEYKLLPQKAKDNLDYIINRSNDVEVLSGESEVLEKNRFFTFYSFKANTLKNGTVYEFPYLYYPGYEIRYDGVKTDYFESENGMIAINMDAEKETHFELSYVGSKIMNYSKIISIIGFVVFSIYVYKKR